VVGITGKEYAKLRGVESDGLCPIEARPSDLLFLTMYGMGG
jgi:hypothetical protein